MNFSQSKDQFIKSIQYSINFIKNRYSSHRGFSNSSYGGNSSRNPNIIRNSSNEQFLMRQKLPTKAQTSKLKKGSSMTKKSKRNLNITIGVVLTVILIAIIATIVAIFTSKIMLYLINLKY